jgi:hypothetical protein
MKMAVCWVVAPCRLTASIIRAMNHRHDDGGIKQKTANFYITYVSDGVVTD